MKKKFIVLAVSGLLLTAGSLYMQEATACSNSEQNILETLTAEQRADVKQHSKSQAAQYKAAGIKLSQDREALIKIITSEKIDQNALNNALKIVASDQVEKNKIGMLWLNYAYNKASEVQKEEIVKQLNEHIDRHSSL